MTGKFFYLRSRLISPAFLIAICFLIYYKASNFNFLHYDDDQNILSNESLLRLDFRSIWTEYYYGMYIPVTYSLWALLSKLNSSPNASVFHFFNIFLHAFNSIFVFFILKKFLATHCRQPNIDNFFPALIGAFLFCTHPMQVETVSWISCGRDLLSAAFAFATILLFLSNFRNKIGFASTFFILGLLCKPSIVPVSFFLLFYEFYITRKSAIVALKNTWVLLVGSLISIIGTNIGQSDVIIKNGAHYGVFESINNSINSLFFYVSKIIIPYNLSANYFDIFNEHNDSTSFYLKLFLVLALAIFILCSWIKLGKVIQIGLVFFLSSISVILGIVPFAFQIVAPVADRYAYLPMLGISVIFAYFALKTKIAFLGIAVLVVFTILSYQRVDIWKNDKTYFSSIFKYNPNNYTALNGLGFVAFGENNFSDAEQFFTKAIEINPMGVNAVNNYIILLTSFGKFEKVISVANTNLTSQFLNRHFGVEEMSSIYLSLGYTNAKLGRVAESVIYNCEALKHDPNNHGAFENLIAINKVIEKSEIQNHMPEFCKLLFRPN